ncbi:ectomycorrhiza-regulated esterase [Gloeopeniophorella convolvens]|nr:ectomycorrhiza-regulated esterase [Gloeopeniophorella convolvens]
MSGRKSTKLSIQHLAVPDVSLVGILEQLEPAAPSRGRKIALILHGTMGHKDYLFQKGLAAKLPIDSFRFDFRGSHESGGKWRYDGFADDVEDIRTVVANLTQEYGYVVDLLVGHSRGSIAAMRWLCTSEEGKHVSGFVNVSGRYKMDRVLHGRPFHVNEHGYYDWKTTVARKEYVIRLTDDDLHRFASWDTSVVSKSFPPNVHVLTIHGMADKLVPPYDGVTYARIFGARTPGTHNLHLVEHADHNFSEHRDEVIDTILEWWAKREHGDVKTGLWHTGVYSKL